VERISAEIGLDSIAALALETPGTSRLEEHDRTPREAIETRPDQIRSDQIKLQTSWIKTRRPQQVDPLNGMDQRVALAT
jgi:hypothetical protein